MTTISLVFITAFLFMGGTAYGQTPGCTSIPNQGICPSPTPTTSPTPDASVAPTPVPTVEATVGVQETRPPWRSPLPPALPGDKARGEVVRRTNNPSHQVHDGGAEELAYTGITDVGTLLLILLVVWSFGFLMIWLSERKRQAR